MSARVGIFGGRTDRLVLRLPPAARQVSIVGPDVREARISVGGATVFLRGAITGQTRLEVSYELPLGAGNIQRLQRLDLQGGHFSAGTVVVTNTAGGTETLPHAVTGLREIHPEDLPAEARRILAGKPVLAYEITARDFAAAVDVVRLGEFALRESIADLAHYQLLLRPDGEVLCKVDYEIRNRTRQFLRLTLPGGAQVLAARVNDKPRPLTPLAGRPGVHRRQPVGNRQLMLETGMLEFRAVCLIGLSNDRAYVGRLHRVFLAAGLDPREVENVVHQVRQPCALARDDRIVLLSLLVGSNPPGL